MRTHKRTISCIVPRGEYFGTWLKGDFVSHYPCLFHDVNTVLDLGCGRQEIKGFMPEGVNYIGIDMDPDCSPNPDIVCDIGLIPLKDDSADIVMALGLDIFKIPGAVREMKRLLRPGGYFVFQGSSEYFHLINARRILRDNGFEIEEEFRQVIEYPEASLRFVYYISRPRREGDGMGC